jgi:hypothetical protein
VFGFEPHVTTQNKRDPIEHIFVFIRVYGILAFSGAAQRRGVRVFAYKYCSLASPLRAVPGAAFLIIPGCLF